MTKEKLELAVKKWVISEFSHADKEEEIIVLSIETRGERVYEVVWKCDKDHSGMRISSDLSLKTLHKALGYPAFWGNIEI